VSDIPTVRLITDDERADAVGVIGQGFLSPMSDEIVDHWATWTDPERTHAAVERDRIVGVARWFPTELMTPGGRVDAGAVTAVAVLPMHRRRGHLGRLMGAQLAQITDQGAPVAILVSADWPIYGRYGYGPATEACAWEVDARTPMAGTGRGEIELVTPPEAREHIDRLHDAMGATWPGVITRTERFWDGVAGIEERPGNSRNPALERSALWRDDTGVVRGVVRYRVEERWTRNRADGRATATELFADGHDAARELWRHLLSLDWVTVVRAEHRPLDDAIQLWMVDGRAAVQRDRFDHVWARILDVPAALSARQAGATGEVVVDVVDGAGPAAGRWRLSGDAGEPISVSETSETAGVRLPVSALGAAYLGGTSVARLDAGGWLDEERPGDAARLGALLGWPVPPWTPTQF
jgi:predicted acetyltransferase